jgi:pimeloyl-ACP methyl ester carboxylesterase
MIPLMSRACRIAVAAILLSATSAAIATGQELPRGTIIDDVKCANDPTQSYALYLPSAYSADRKWSVLIGFHPAGRGRAIVEKYRAAAEQYGYVLAASNNSRNGPWEVSIAAVRAMMPDLGARFSLDEKRIYLTGHSGGARVAMQVALANKAIAGVIASSGGYPDSQPRARVTFAVFSTAGSEDFNYIEMRMLDRKLMSPHRLGVFEGGHTLPTDDVALEAIEWMEVQATKSGARSRDDVLIEQLVAKRHRQIAASTSESGTVHLLDAFVEDFSGLRDVTAEAARAKDLRKQRDVKKALERERDADDEEARTIWEFVELEAALADSERRTQSLMTLRDRLSKLAKQAAGPDPSPERTQSRRVLRAVTAGAAGRVQDREYRALLQQYATAR